MVQKLLQSNFYSCYKKKRAASWGIGTLYGN